MEPKNEMSSARRHKITRPTATVIMGYAILAASLLPHCSGAQCLYLDSNADGLTTTADAVSMSAANTVDVWINTDTNGDGSAAAVPAQDRGRMTINSYSINLRAEGGEVEFGEYQNLQPTMTLPVGLAKNKTEMHVAYAGAIALPPGRYLLGRFTFRVLSGDPEIIVAPRSSLDPTFGTSFGSRYGGRDGDNTLKLSNRDDEGRLTALTSEWAGDWTDATGLRAGLKLDSSSPGSVRSLEQGTVAYGVRVLAPTPSGEVRLLVTTTGPDQIHVDLYDVRGRLVRSVANFRATGTGAHEVVLFNRDYPRTVAASGVYFYRVHSVEGTRTGKVLILR